MVKSWSICVHLLPLVLLPSILPSKIPCRKLSCLSTWPIHLCFHCHISFSRLLSSFPLQHIIIGYFISPADFFICLQIHISKASIFFLSTSLKVHVSAAYIATNQTRHLTIFFFSSRFIFPVNNFLLSWNTFFTIPILLAISFSQIHPYVCVLVQNCLQVIFFRILFIKNCSHCLMQLLKI